MLSRQAVITFSTVSCPLVGSWQPLRAVASVRKPGEREEAGGRRMGEPLIAGAVPSTAAGATLVQPAAARAIFSCLEFQNLALCKKKIFRHIKLAVYVWSTKY